jgi:multiple sugar transport system substrate-binding protein
MDFARFTASPDTQMGLYFQSGGQPGHRAAWLDEEVNAACHDFFRDTLRTLDESLLRPQFPGYMAFQDEATPVAHAAVGGRMNPESAAVEINRLYQKHLHAE